ncbi:hypothetical protein DFH06DRAFT_1150361 [Mycena polygramma]|nr:hypothetical protein DFH06DRAFT_1150361 [Mycena polygramma]
MIAVVDGLDDPTENEDAAETNQFYSWVSNMCLRETEEDVQTDEDHDAQRAKTNLSDKLFGGLTRIEEEDKDDEAQAKENALVLAALTTAPMSDERLKEDGLKEIPAMQEDVNLQRAPREGFLKCAPCIDAGGKAPSLHTLARFHWRSAKHHHPFDLLVNKTPDDNDLFRCPAHDFQDEDQELVVRHLTNRECREHLKHRKVLADKLKSLVSWAYKTQAKNKAMSALDSLDRGGDGWDESDSEEDGEDEDGAEEEPERGASKPAASSSKSKSAASRPVASSSKSVPSRASSRKSTASGKDSRLIVRQALQGVDTSRMQQYERDAIQLLEMAQDELDSWD